MLFRSGFPAEIVAADRETIASLATATGLTAEKVAGKRSALVQSVGGSPRYCVEGSTPTTSSGLVLWAGSIIEVDGLEMTRFKAIDYVGTATLEVVYKSEGGE